MTQLYETMYIIRPDLGEETVDQVINQYQSLLRDQGAEDVQTQHRGKRRLAYEIRKFREGIYVQMNYKAAGPLVANLQRAMRLSDEVIRYLTICQDEPDTDVEAATA
uniref:Small ribosomal subunit protein bS6 n=1 Tax=Cyanothece sp. (strain PCC 7425 / ATCC 29141) TaxID=395961 RepID=RS6_CYAP4|nr:RecName: Full=Small ribosomal subunit protein bS6; AltName: Full=30S ribosomal protein S6 [Cyanothece sp. PCC 7425]